MGRVVICTDETRIVRHSDIRAWLAEGATPEQVASMIGVSPTTVYNHLRRMGLSPMRGRWEKRGPIPRP